MHKKVLTWVSWCFPKGSDSHLLPAFLPWVEDSCVRVGGGFGRGCIYTHAVLSMAPMGHVKSTSTAEAQF